MIEYFINLKLIVSFNKFSIFKEKIKIIYFNQSKSLQLLFYTFCHIILAENFVK